ncbi:MAG: hypothetical protein ACREYE_30455 [Gammaproteobacteria bacterium]
MDLSAFSIHVINLDQRRGMARDIRTASTLGEVSGTRRRKALLTPRSLQRTVQDLQALRSALDRTHRRPRGIRQAVGVEMMDKADRRIRSQLADLLRGPLVKASTPLLDKNPVVFRE